jgi:hypothetical protein
MYTNARYYEAFSGVIVSISVEINGTPSSVPIDTANTDYANIMVLVEAGELTIAPAEGG